MAWERVIEGCEIGEYLDEAVVRVHERVSFHFIDISSII